MVLNWIRNSNKNTKTTIDYNNKIERDKDNNIKKIDMLLEMDELYFNL